MRVIHRISLSVTKDQLAAIQQLGIQYDEIRPRRIIMEVEESTEPWQKFTSMFPQWEASDLLRTEFTVGELDSAEYLVMEPSWHYGYPQPEDDYRLLTYDTSGYCHRCGVGLRQQEPFRILAEPKWGSNHILQLDCVADEFFVRPDVWTRVFKRHGVESEVVVNHKTGKPLSSVMQLKIVARTMSRITRHAFLPKQCPACKRVKLTNNAPGFFPNVELPSGVHIAKTIDYFGAPDGPDAWQEVVVSQDLYQAIKAEKLQGAFFGAVAGRGS